MPTTLQRLALAGLLAAIPCTLLAGEVTRVTLAQGSTGTRAEIELVGAGEIPIGGEEDRADGHRVAGRRRSTTGDRFCYTRSPASVPRVADPDGKRLSPLPRRPAR